MSEDLVILGTMDVHELASLKPLVDSVRGVNPGRVLLLGGGDLWQANPLAFVYAQRRGNDPAAPVNLSHAAIRAMNLMEYDASAIGDRDLSYGLEYLDKVVAQADFPFVSANIFRHGTPVHAYRPYTLIPHALADGDTVLVGVTGTTPPGVHSRHESVVAGVLEIRDPIAAVGEVVRELRGRGADLVVVLAHGRLEGTTGGAEATGLPAEIRVPRLAREVAGIDVVFLGHTRRELADTTVNGVLFVEAGDRSPSVAAVTVRLERPGPGVWAVVHKTAEILRPAPARADQAAADRIDLDSSATERAAPGSTAEARFERYRREIGPGVDAVVATLARPLERVRPESGLGHLIADARRRATDAQVAIVNVDGIQSGLDAGPVTRGELFRVQPFQNRLIRLRMTGSQLRSALERSLAGDAPAVYVSGVVVWYDPARSVGSRILTLELVDGAPVETDRLYTVTVDDVLAGGSDAFAAFAHALGRTDTGILALEALVRYLDEHPQPVDAPTEPRLRAVPAEVQPPAPNPGPPTSPVPGRPPVPAGDPMH